MGRADPCAGDARPSAERSLLPGKNVGRSYGSRSTDVQLGTSDVQKSIYVLIKSLDPALCGILGTSKTKMTAIWQKCVA